MMSQVARYVGPPNYMAQIVDPPCFTLSSAKGAQVAQRSMGPKEWVLHGIARETREAYDLASAIESVPNALGSS